MLYRILIALALGSLSACSSFNNPYAAYVQKDYEVSDTSWRTAGAWRMKWVESDTVVPKDPTQDPKQKSPLLMERLSDHETENPEPSVSPDF
ncbi:MAG: hypothetical protein K2X47_02280 [Bdellovibrionales bacterium]|nr:hypothetical protein [Bdellovibrionales bacterium]